MTFSAEGDRLAPASHDMTVWVWDAHTGWSLHTLQSHTSYVNCVAFSPAGDRLASGSDDKTVRVWDGGRCTSSRVIRLMSPAWLSSAGDRLASVSYDNTVRLWDAKTACLLHTLMVDQSKYEFAFSLNGIYLETEGGSMPLHSPVSSNTTPQQPLQHILVKDRWITVDSEDML